LNSTVSALISSHLYLYNAIRIVSMQLHSNEGNSDRMLVAGTVTH